MSKDLKQKYGFPVAFSMVVGVVIGIGIFFKAAPVIQASGMNPGIAISAWILSGAISIFAGLTVAELGASVPEKGGLLAWIRKIYGDKIGFLVGWSQTIIYGPGLIAVLCYYFGLFALSFLGYSDDYVNSSTHIFISLAVFLAAIIPNTFTTKSGGIIQTIATVGKMFPLAAIIIFGFLSKNNSVGILQLQDTSQSVSGNPFLLLGAALVPTMFAFDGWIYVGNISAELKHPKKDLPKAIVLGLGFITLVYVLLNIAMLKVFPADVLVKEGMFGVAQKMLGDSGAKFIFGGILVSSYGGINGFTLIMTRVPYTLAREGHFIKGDYFSEVNERFAQPIRSCILIFILVLFYLVLIFVSKNPDLFTDIPVALFWIFYVLSFIGVILLRKREPELERPYKAPLYPVIPSLAIIGGSYIAINAVIANPLYMIISIFVTLSGLVFYQKTPLTVSD